MERLSGEERQALKDKLTKITSANIGDDSDPESTNPTFTLVEITEGGHATDRDNDQEAATLRQPNRRQRRDTPTSGWSRVTPSDLSDDRQPTDPSPPEHQRSTISSNLSDVMDTLSSTEGFIAAAIGDSSSGMTLDSRGGGDNFNIEVAIATNTEVVKAKHRAMDSLGLDGEIEDILITLDSQYHLIRPTKDRPNIFMYVAVDRERANLAMTRMTLSDAESKLEL